MTKTCSGLEKDFIIDTLIKKNAMLKNQDMTCIIEIVSQTNNQIQTLMHSKDRTAPESGMYTAQLDELRTVSLILTYKSHEKSYHIFLLPETIAIHEVSLKKHTEAFIEFTCTLGHEQLDLSVSKQTQYHARNCIIFSEILTQEPLQYESLTSIALPMTTIFPWHEGTASMPELARIALEAQKLIVFDYMYGIPETACCIGNRLLLRDEFETRVKQSSKQTQDAIKQELKQIAMQKANLCLYPLSCIQENLSGISMWNYQNITKEKLLTVIHLLDAVVLGLLCKQNINNATILGIFIHGILIMLDSVLTTTSGTCMLVLEKRRIRGTITFFLLSKGQSGYLYYGQLSAFEPEDFRYLAEYILQKPLTEQDFDSAEFKAICSL